MWFLNEFIIHLSLSLMYLIVYMRVPGVYLHLSPTLSVRLYEEHEGKL